MINSVSSLQFSIQPTSSSTGCSISFYISSYLTLATTFNNLTSCIIKYPNNTNVIANCFITQSSNYLLINITSSGTNYFPSGIISTVVINDLKYSQASSHSNYIYDFYFIFM